MVTQSSFGLLLPGSTSTPRVLLLSGGLDSTTLLATLAQDASPPQALFVDYAQPAAAREWAAARAVCDHFSAPLSRVQIEGFAVTPGSEIMGRNSLLALFGLKQAMPEGVVFLGVHAGTGYADCSATFLEAQQQVFDIYANGRVTLSAPLFAGAARLMLLPRVQPPTRPLGGRLPSGR